jgi:DNA-binding GntR family transcriptional regulator
LQAADNSALTSLHTMLDRRLRGLLALAHKPPPRWDEAVVDHERMVKALQTRDGSALARVAREHLRHKADVAKEALERLEQRSGERKRGFEALRGGR